MTPLLPGATIGILGSGQLGRMIALAGRRLGYDIAVYSPDAQSPAGAPADREWVGEYEDLEQVRRFAQMADVVTCEFENVPASAAASASAVSLLRPSAVSLLVAQNRLREKNWLRDQGAPCAPYRDVRSLAQLHAGLRELGCPALLKSAGFGYDGKGQQKILQPDDADAAWAAQGGAECVLEGVVPFDLEFSVIGARGVDGSFRAYGPIENRHRGGILDLSLYPAASPIASAAAAEACAIVRTFMENLDMEGLLCVEFFLCADKVVVNELAPRPHNSGHLTIDNCLCSQFEQLIRAICGLPLGLTEPRCPAAMANLLGDLWNDGEPNWAEALRLPGISLHLYGKREARPGRKMGHLAALGATPEQAAERALEARDALLIRSSSG